MRSGIRVADAMTTKPVTASKDISIQECAMLMKKFDVGSVIIKEDGKLAGLVTEYDLTRKVIAGGMSHMDSCEDIMEEALITIEPDKDMTDALKMMKDNEVRHLPVVSDGELKGLITMKDILRIEPELFQLVVDNIHLREEHRKPLYEIQAEEGICESCLEYSEKLYEVDGAKVCKSCKAQSE